MPEPPANQKKKPGLAPGIVTTVYYAKTLSLQAICAETALGKFTQKWQEKASGDTFSVRNCQKLLLQGAPLPDEFEISVSDFNLVTATPEALYVARCVWGEMKEDLLRRGYRVAEFRDPENNRNVARVRRVISAPGPGSAL